MKRVGLSGHCTASLTIAESTGSEVLVKSDSYGQEKPNIFVDFSISSIVLIGSLNLGSIRNVVRYAWNTVLIATL